jgi:hypothetical protein
MGVRKKKNRDKESNKRKSASSSTGKRRGLKKAPKEVIEGQVLSLLRQCYEAKNIDEALQVITSKGCALVGGQGGSIWLRSSEDPSRVVLRWTYRPEGPNVVGVSYYTNILDSDGYYGGLTAWVFARGESLCLRDITDRKEIAGYPHLRWSDKYGGFKKAQDREKQKHFMAVPIFSCRVKRDVIGILRIGASKTTKAFQPVHLKLLEAYAGYISGLLTNYLKREEERTLIERLFTVASESGLELLLEETAKTIPLVMDGSHCSIFLKDRDNDFCLEASSAPHLQALVRSRAPKSCLKYKLGEGKTGRVASGGDSVRVSGNIRSEAGKSADLCECGTASAAFLAVAIREKNGKKPVGVLRVVRSLDINEPFDEEDERFLVSFGQKLYKCLNVHGYFAKGTCFVITPFGKPFDGIYDEIVKPAVEKYDFICRREKDYGAIGGLTTGIVSHIASANFIVADITGDNRNVYYELGIAHTLDKTVILISQTEPPSDLVYWKYIRYENVLTAWRRLTLDIESAIKGGIADGKIKRVG